MSKDVSTLTVQDSEDSPRKQKGQDDDKVVNVQVADALHEDDVKREGDEDDDGVKDLKNNSNSRGSCYLSHGTIDTHGHCETCYLSHSNASLNVRYPRTL